MKTTKAITKERPILFSSEMVKSILEGRKTMTRRIVKNVKFELKENGRVNYELRGKSGGGLNNDIETLNDEFFGVVSNCPYGKKGDVLWVRETYKYLDFIGEENAYVYKASENGKDWEENCTEWKWKPSLFMPKAAARIWLEITDIKVERLHDITEEDAIAERVERGSNIIGPHLYYKDYSCKRVNFIFRHAITSFNALWCEINGMESFNENPWVWCVSFKVQTEKL